MSGTFCKANYDQRPKLSSRNNLAAYSGIYSTLDNAKHHTSQQENVQEDLLMKRKDSAPSDSKFECQYGLNLRMKDNPPPLSKVGHNWAINQPPNWVSTKSKNYRSMTSLMNRPSVGRKFSLQKNKNTFVLNDSSSFASKNTRDVSVIDQN